MDRSNEQFEDRQVSAASDPARSAETSVFVPLRITRPGQDSFCVTDEFPPGADEWPDDPGRRRFLNIMTASMALAGLQACVRFPSEAIVPYVKQPPEIVPGLPLYFATATMLDGYALGTLVQSREGRPIKIEGNPNHPASMGATDVFAQASVLGLYDPDRSQAVTYFGEVTSYSQFLAEFSRRIVDWRNRGGKGLAILTDNFTSPTLLWQMQNLLKSLPQAQWHVHAPAQTYILPQRVYQFSRAQVILALDSDFMIEEPGRVRYARDFINQRRVRKDNMKMNRLYVAEPTPSVTGSNADHRLPVRASDIHALATAIAQRLGVADAEQDNAEPPDEHRQWIDAVAEDLQNHRGASLVIAGRTQPPEVHAVVDAINLRLGNFGRTVFAAEIPDALHAPKARDLASLAAAIANGSIDTLIILDSNPVYSAPADFDFANLLTRVPTCVHYGLYQDQTALLCQWHIPATHELEMWSDARAYDGAASIVQPLIAPLYQGVSPHEFLAALQGIEGLTGHEIIQDYWKQQLRSADFEKWWKDALHAGVIQDSPVNLQSTPQRAIAPDRRSQPAAQSKGDLEIVFRLDPRVWDGRYANNAWLQELPKPLTKVTWDNVILISPRLADELQMTYGSILGLSYKGREVHAPVWILPGQADRSITVYLGYGHQNLGRVADGAGFNAYQLRTSQAPWFDAGLNAQRMPGSALIATTQPNQQQHERGIVQRGTLRDFQHDPSSALDPSYYEPDMTLLRPYAYDGYKWGMNIDLTACIGCGTCTIACQAENNIPVVGKEGVLEQRVMHWIRVDRYFMGDANSPDISHAPVPCMHCENAPCELVCPVGATLHSDEGLNLMIYNRCIGTRYCSNNCPYKVRRFNFFDYMPDDPEVVRMQRNPEVTVRSRGVMEKCTYCVQRIEHARITAEKQNRVILESEVVPACAQACPTNAIVFGNLNDPDQRVTRMSKEPHAYSMLAELNTRPRTTYLARLRNPNPKLQEH